MTIRTSSPREIPLTPAMQVDAENAFALTDDVPVEAPSTTFDRKFADVEYKYQQHDEWCWAACMEMVLGNQNLPSPDQCGFAGYAFSIPTCCAQPFDNQCDQPLSILAIGNEYARWGVSSLRFDRPISFEHIVEEIGKNRVVQVGLLLPQALGGAHVLLIVGWDEDEDGRYLIVYDPQRGPGSMWYDDLIVALGHGHWQFTWTNLEG